jgi:2',3'-cyclic-nucleotide 2'-phosphodiesterase (5'-nucleotidase family)
LLEGYEKQSRLRMCRVVRHTIQALPLRSMLGSEIHGEKTQMRYVFKTRVLTYPAILLTVLVFATSLMAQSPVIEPCPATPAPKILSSTVTTPTGSKASETQIDSSIASDPDVEKVIGPYREKVTALSVVIGTLQGQLTKGSIGAGSLGNFVTDAILSEARRITGKPVTFAILNAGGLRKNSIAPGQLRASDIFELLPFENQLLTVDLTGAQLLKLSQFGTRDAQAGARVQFKWNEQNRTQIISTKLIDINGREQKINPEQTYTIVTTDYLYKLQSGNYALLREGENVNSLKVSIREAVMAYVKSETAAGRPIRARLDDRFVQIGPGPTNPEVRPND